MPGPVSAPPAPERHVALPLDRSAPTRLRADLDDDVVDLVITIDVDDVVLRPSSLEPLADLARSTGWHLVVVVYEAEEAVGKDHAPPVVPPGLPLLETRVARGWSTAIGWALPHLRGRRTVVLDATVQTSAEHLRSLADALTDGPDGVVVAQAVLRTPQGPVATAGAVPLSPLSAPASLLAGFPPEDAERLGVVDVWAADAPVFAVRTAGLVPPPATVDLPLAVVGLTRAVVEAVGPAARVVSVPSGRSYQRRPPLRSLDAGAQDLLLTWRDVRDDRAAEALAALGLELHEGPPLVQISADGRAPSRISSPRITPTAGRGPGPRWAVHERPPRLRWSIKTAAWPDARGDDWGDTHFATDLAAALVALGQDAVIDARLSHVRPASEHLDEVSLVLRGLDRTPLSPYAVNVSWVISHPDLVSGTELAGYDLRYAASTSWAARATTTAGVSVRPLLQATDPARFRPREKDASLVSDVLFVGKTRGVARPVVSDAIAAGLELSLWGEGWAGAAPPGAVRGEYLPNELLPVAYSNARVVLSDHWADMAREGFVSNRVFDALATGAVVVTDRVAGLDEALGGLVLTYDGVDDLRRVVDSVGPIDAADRESRAASVAREHSFTARAQVLLDDVVRAARESPAR
ncbi:glycosyltransferase [Frigoribacterium sp. PhB116]|uniref:glycosyltransferase n=1 Tax=Frigoribacterium sp. PhB116 TaxID=2485174 RepID=UPI0010E2CA5A|nr:glycosyltransferase [Frigoribacterium sp. PhB116]TDT66076.1 hypothetical protein EDF20_0880 [Frigoribacterium sp. PhB116]